MAKTSTEETNENLPASPRSQDLLANKTKDIVMTFVEEKKEKDSGYFNNDKETIVKDFQEYMKENYDEGLLKTLQQSGQLDVQFNQVAQKGFTLKDFLNPGKNTIIKNQLGTTTTEKVAMSEITIDCYKEWGKLSDTQKKSFPFDDFLREVGYKTQTNQDGDVVDIIIPPNAVETSVVGLKKAWERFTHQHTTSSESFSLYASLMNTDRFDPTEKIACVSAAQQLYGKILNLPAKTRDIVEEKFTNQFGDSVSSKPVSALESRTTLDGLQFALSEFFADVVQDGILNKKQFQDLQSLSVNAKYCLQYGSESGEILDDQAEAYSKRFSELSKKMQNLTDKLVTADIVTKLDETIDSVDTSIKNFANVFDMPGTMKGFFDQFDRKSAKPSMTGEEKTQYDLLNQEYRQLREEIAQAHQDKDTEKIQSLEQQLGEKKKQIDKFTHTSNNPSMDEYIRSIGTTTAHNLAILGKPDDAALVVGVQNALKKIQQGNRDASVLSSQEQNYLMKASVLAQLVKVKESDMMTGLNYDFDQYAQFVSELFDFNTTKSVIMTKDYHPIEINFVKPNGKRMVGKPYDRQNITINNLTDLEQLHVEFEIDLDNDPGGHTAILLKAITGDKQSQIIRDMPFQREGYPETITDSTFVRLTDPATGKSYEGYLSPAYLEQDNHNDIQGSSSDLTFANTLILYDKPADQYHPDRKVITIEGYQSPESAEGGQSKKQTPVFLNADNAAQWNMDVLQKRVTLSDKYLNSLVLGHVLAQEHDLDRLAQAKIDSNFDGLDKRLDTINETDPRQTASESGDTDENDLSESSKDSPHQKLMEGWERLFKNGDGEGKRQPEDGQRFIFEPSEAFQIGGSVPASKDLLSATIQSIQKDESGKVVGFEFAVENLTIGSAHIKKRIWKVGPDTIRNFSDHQNFAGHPYLGRVQELKELPFDQMKMKLSELYPKRNNPDFLWPSLDALTMDTKGLFRKGEHQVTKFTAAQGTTDADGKGKYNVDYTITKERDSYTIVSTPYAVQVDSDKPDEKETKLQTFEITTDLSGLLLIIANKKLIPYTQEELVQGKENGVIPDIRRKKRWSSRTILDFIKKGLSSGVEAWKKKRDEDDSDLDYMIYNQFGLHRRLANTFGGVLEFFDMDFLDDMAGEQEEKGLDYGWKKIEAEFKYLDNFHHSANVNLLGEGSSKQKGANAMAQERVESAMEEYNNNNGNVSYKKRRKVAASLMYMLKKYKNGTARLLDGFPRGTYVKLLFGDYAYGIFKEKYEEKKKLVENSKYGSKIQEDLMTFEYNFIVHNIAGGSLQDERVRDLDPDDTRGGGNTGKNPDAWYYQHLYSRKYGNELRTLVGDLKNLDPSPSNSEVKKTIEGSTFDHMKKEYYSHISQYRIDAALEELVAMQQLATTTQQANEVFIAIMAGLLNGGLIHNLGRNTRDKLRRTCRDSGIPFVPRMEHYDAPQKLQRLLRLSTANLGDKSFDKFTYTIKANMSDTGSNQKYTYQQSQFDPFQRKKGASGAFIGDFASWLGEGTDARRQVINFMTLDNVDADDDDNNMIRIWKSPQEEQDLKIYGEEVKPGDKAIVTELMEELYFNKGRPQSLDQLNYNAWMGANVGNYKGGAHVRTMVEPAYEIVNKLRGDGSFEHDAADHGETLWMSISNRLPKSPLKSTQQYKLAYFVDEFFRSFKQVGAIEYSKSVIEKFYRRIRIIHDNPGLSVYDKKRLLWGYITELAYERGSIPAIIEEALSSYMAFFESNLHLFDEKLVAMHLIPGATRGGDFGYTFTEDSSKFVYYPDKERRKLSVSEQRTQKANAPYEGKIIVNGELADVDINMLKPNSKTATKGTTLDDLIDQRRNARESVDILRLGGGLGQGGGKSNTRPSGLQSLIAATNNDIVDMSVIPQNKAGTHVLPPKKTGSSDIFNKEEILEEARKEARKEAQVYADELF